ncbi:MAG: hypothetical protein WC803_08700 [Sphingomonas sp.]|jgi:hypothetical protein
MIDYILKRLREPSTYAGFAGLALALGLTATEWATISTAVAGIAGVVAMLLTDKSAG